jgi:hypothetical protein
MHGGGQQTGEPPPAGGALHINGIAIIKIIIENILAFIGIFNLIGKCKDKLFVKTIYSKKSHQIIIFVR